ncbi:BatD family protein [Achromobacter deleyi]|uniref:BatD family protein n=1 Tax=Achromobacter deleyi TaxID=1353891 RepID=UPI0014922523|nr:BatD family protein [Achromobacter deleyi]QVQ28160.1 BatD family protein [Achromobacter deleyi]UIP18351.1 BatD family protein [Achromobacter deleyi]
MNALTALLRWIWLLLALSAASAAAQTADPGPQLKVEARMASPGDLMVGATATLQIDVLTSTWFTQPPVLPALDIPGALVSGPSGQATIIRATIDGVAYNGLRFAYLLSPAAAGALRIPAIKVSAQVGQSASPLTAQTRPLEVRAAGPPGATTGHVLAATSVQATQEMQYSAQPPAVGDHVSRVITLQAQGAQAMLIPPPATPAVPGLKPYPSEPVLTQLSDSRGVFLGGQRVDRVDYVVERPGAYELPAIDIRWWNVATSKEEHLVLPAQRFEARAGAAYQAPFSVEQDLRDMGRQVQVRIPGGWLALAAVAVAAALIAWLGAPWWRRIWTWLQARRAARRQRWLASERHAALALRRELAHPNKRLDALYLWLRRSRRAVSLAQATDGLRPALRQAGAEALRECYGPRPDTTQGFRTLRQSFPQWRRAFRRAVAPVRPHRLLPLNPRTPDVRGPSMPSGDRQ